MIYYLLACSEDEYQCFDGQCIPVSRFCDLNRDCADSSDEHNCGESVSHLKLQYMSQCTESFPNDIQIPCRRREMK